MYHQDQRLTLRTASSATISRPTMKFKPPCRLICGCQLPGCRIRRRRRPNVPKIKIQPPSPVSTLTTGEPIFAGTNDYNFLPAPCAKDFLKKRRREMRRKVVLPVIVIEPREDGGDDYDCQVGELVVRRNSSRRKLPKKKKRDVNWRRSGASSCWGG
jgi:hypothetical protein